MMGALTHLDQDNSAGPGTRRLAYGLVAALLALTAVILPFADHQWPALPLFVPLHGGVVLVSEAVTAFLLFGLFLERHTLPLLLLAAAYLSTALLVPFFVLAFPGTLVPGEPVIGGPQTAVWLWHLWHSIFPGLLLAALISGDIPLPPLAQPERSATLTAGVVAAGVCILVVLTTAGHDLLPPLIQRGPRTLTTAFYWAGGVVMVVSFAALALALWRARRGGVLYLWLSVALAAAVGDALTSLSAGARFTVGWYLGRVDSMIAAMVLLLVLLGQVLGVYRRLAGAIRERDASNLALRHEMAAKERLLTELGERNAQLDREIRFHTQAALALRGAEARFHDAITQAPIPIMIHAEDGSVLLLSDSWLDLTGYARGDLLTMEDWTRRAHGPSSAAVLTHIQRLYARSGAHDDGTWDITTAAGKQRLWAFRSASLPPLDDGRRLMVSMAVDITDTANAEARAAAAARALQSLRQGFTDVAAFSAATARDLRDPVRTISSFANLLDRRHGDRLDDQGRDYIAYILDAAQRLEALAGDLQTYARFSQNEDPKAPVSITAVLQTMDAALANTARACGATIVHPATLPTVLGQRGAIEHLFQALVANALKYRSPDRPPRVEITCEPDGTGWRFAVHDNGVGFPPEQAEALFMPFSRLHERGEASSGGNGIGLAVCQAIVEGHGGSIRADSLPGRGSTVVFSLPGSA